MKSLLGFFVLLFVASTTLSAQTATIRGTVLDDRQAAITGARVVLKSVDQIVAEVQTGPQGTFDTSLMPGRYTVEITASGFEDAVHVVNLTPSLAPLPISLSPVSQEASLQAHADDDQEMEEYLLDFLAPLPNTADRDLVFNLLLDGPSTAAQGPTMRGTVLDDDQLTVIGADVVVKSGDKVVAEAQTGVDGGFNIPLKAGQYTVEVTVSGFDKAVHTVNVTPDLVPFSIPMRAPR